MQAQAEPRKRGTRAGKSRRFSGSTAAGFSGEGCNMRCGTSGGRAYSPEQLWWAHVPSNGTPTMEPVIGGLDMQPGKYGTNTQHLRIPEAYTGLVR